MAQRPQLRLPDWRALKKYNFVIASKAKQSVFEIAKSALSLVLRLLQDFVLRNQTVSQLNFLPRKRNNQVLKLSEVSLNKTIDTTPEICYTTST